MTSIQLEPGDRVLFYSDGIPEATNGDREMLGADGFVRMLEASTEQPLNDCIVASMKALKRWSDPVPFADDISLLALEMPAAE